MPPASLAYRFIVRFITAAALALSTLAWASTFQPANASTTPSTPRVNKFVATSPTSVAVQPYARCWLGGSNCWGSADGGAPTSLTVVVVENPTLSCTVASSLSWCTIPGLNPDQTYSFIATASNSSGTSPASSPTPTLTTPTALFTVENGPRGVAVTGDGTYAVVANYDSDSITRITLADGTVASTAVGNGPDSVALYGDYAYVTNSLANSLTRVDLNNSTTTTISVCSAPQGIVISPDGTTAYVACSGSNQIQPVSLNTFTAGTAVNIPGGAGYLAIDPAGAAVFTWKAFGSGTATLSRLRLSDDSITHTASVQRDAVGLSADATHVLTLNSTGLLTKFLASDLTSVSSFDVGPQEFTALAGSPTGTEVYAIARNTHLFHAADTTSMTVTRTFLVGDCTHPSQAAVDPTNSYILVSSACGAPGRAWRYSLSPVATVPTISSVSPATGPQAGGTTVTINGTNLAVPLALTFGGVSAVSFSGISATQISAVTPPGMPGPVDVTITTSAGSTTSLAGFTYQADATPAPPPTFPPAAPTSVTAVAGDRSAVVTWQEPVDAGSFSITRYQVTAEPGRHTCLTTTTTCVIDGLTPAIGYTFTVRALNGAGWGSASEPSAALVWPDEKPASILVTGGRTTGNRIAFTGTITGSQQTEVQPMMTFAGERSPRMGRLVSPAEDGTFTWGRRLSRAATIWFIAGDATSTPVEIAATRRASRR